MLTINFKPKGRMNAAPLDLYWNDPVLTIDSVDYDLSELEDGEVAKHSVLKRAERIDEDYIVSIILPHLPDAPHDMRFPMPLQAVGAGSISLPTFTTGE